MSKLGKWITVVTLLSLGLFIAVFLSEQLFATIDDVTVASATQRQEEFSNLLVAAKRGDFTQAQFQAMTSEDPADYAFITYTVTLSGFCPLPVKWAQVNLAPIAGDMLLLSDPVELSPFGKQTLTATLVTSAAAAGAPRSLWVEYYVLGRAMSAAVHAS